MKAKFGFDDDQVFEMYLDKSLNNLDVSQIAEYSNLDGAKLILALINQHFEQKDS